MIEMYNETNATKKMEKVEKQVIFSMLVEKAGAMVDELRSCSHFQKMAGIEANCERENGECEGIIASNIASKNNRVAANPSEGKFVSGKEDIQYQKGREESVSEKVLQMFNNAKNGKLTGKSIRIDGLTSEGKKILEDLSGLKMKDNIDFRLNPSDLVHINNEHYGNKEKDKGNNIPLTDYDMQRLVDVIAFPTDIVYGVDKQGRKMFFFLKQEPSFTYNLLMIHSDSKGNLTMKTYYKTKRGVSQRVMEIQSLLSTSGTYSGATSNSSAKIVKIIENPTLPSKKKLTILFGIIMSKLVIVCVSLCGHNL